MEGLHQRIQGGLRTEGKFRLEDSEACPLVSIITVVLNGGETVERTIRSVINQTYKNIEYIIIDGQSTDGTLDIIERYNDRIAYWVSEKDDGLFDAMNKGISLAKGSIIGILNSDDWYALDAVENVERNSKGQDVIYGNILRYYPQHRHSELIKTDIRKLKYGSSCLHPAVFIREEVYKQRKYDTRYTVSADNEFLFNLYSFKKYKFKHIDKILTHMTSGGISSQKKIIGYGNRFSYYWKYKNIFGLAGTAYKSSLYAVAIITRRIFGQRFYSFLNRRFHKVIKL